MAITPKMIQELREKTGVGIGKCKEALEQTSGDMQLAIENLRKAGIATAVKKEGRSTNEGMIGTAENSERLAVVEVNAETDFVVKNDRFQKFLSEIAEEVAATNPASLDAFLNQKFSKDRSVTIDEYRATIVQAIGENIQVKRIITFQKTPAHSLGVYSHLGGKVVTVVLIDGSNQAIDLAKNVAMHIAATQPEYVNPEDVPADIISKEREIAASKMQGKPAGQIDKIVEGMLSKYFDEICLNRQPYIKDDKLKIGDLVQKYAKDSGQQLAIKNFIRWSVGQG